MACAKDGDAVQGIKLYYFGTKRKKSLLIADLVIKGLLILFGLMALCTLFEVVIFLSRGPM